MSNKFLIKYKWDNKFFLSIIGMLIIGVIMVYSASYFEIGYRRNDQNALIKKEIVFAVSGIFMMWIASKINYNYLKKLVVPINIFVIITYILLIPIFKLSTEFRGGIRWISFGGIQFMPSDLAKFATIITMAYLFSSKSSKKRSTLDIFLFLCPIIYIVGTVLQPDISTAVVIIGAYIVTLYLGLINEKLLIALFTMASSVISIYIFMSDTRLDRVKVFLNPFIDTTGDGYQVVQSLVAVASGGLKGVGLGNSRQKMLYLPLSYNDYIFSIYAEELGFIGSIILISIFAMLVLRGFKIAMNAPDKFSTILVGGIVAQIAIQSIINLYVAVNLLPSTGINLPLISYGGTSLITTLMALGVVLGVSRFENKTVPEAFKPVEEKKYYSLESRDKK